MTSSETKSQPTRQRMVEEFVERYQSQPGLYKMSEARPTLETQFQFPTKVWDKLRPRKGN